MSEKLGSSFQKPDRAATRLTEPAFPAGVTTDRLVGISPERGTSDRYEEAIGHLARRLEQHASLIASLEQTLAERETAAAELSTTLALVRHDLRIKDAYIMALRSELAEHEVRRRNEPIREAEVLKAHARVRELDRALAAAQADLHAVTARHRETLQLVRYRAADALNTRLLRFRSAHRVLKRWLRSRLGRG